MTAGGTGSNHRASIAFFILLECGILGGVFPFAMFLGRPYWLAWAALGPVLVALAAFRKSGYEVARHLSPLEFFACAGAALFEGTVVSLILFVFYGGLRGLLAAIGAIGVHLPWSAADIGRITSAMLLAVFVPGSCSNMSKLFLKRLFPPKGIGDAPLFPGLTSTRFCLAAMPVLAAAALLIVVGLRGWPAAWILLMIEVLVVSIPLHNPLERGEGSPQSLRVLAAVGKLLQADGYATLDRLRSSDPVIGRLISVYDLIAHRDGVALALRLKTTGEEATPVGWTEAAALRTAVRAIHRAIQENGIRVDQLIPVILLAGRAPGQGLLEFAADEGIRVVEILDPGMIDQVLGTTLPEEELRRLSHDLFSPAAPASSTTRDLPVAEAN